MPAETFVRVDGQARKIGALGVSTKIGGVWTDVQNIYARADGTWRTVYVRDNSGPATPVNAQAKWIDASQTGGKLRITWENPVDPDYDFMRVEVKPGSLSWRKVADVSAPGTSLNYDDYIVFNVVYQVKLTPYDENGNAGTPVQFSSMSFTGEARGLYPSPWYFDPIDSGTYRNGLYRTDSLVLAQNGAPTRVLQGATSTGENIGVWFYGTQFWDKIRGADCFGATMEYFRVNSSGQPGAVEPEILVSTTTTSKATPPSGGQHRHVATGVCINGTCNPWAIAGLPAQHLPFFVSPTLAGSCRAMLWDSTDTTLVGDYSLSYGRFYGVGDNVGTVGPGRIWVAHSG